MAKVIGKPKSGQEIDVKWFYIAGVKVEDDCPTCGKHVVYDLGRDYLSYPCFGTSTSVGFYCSGCDGEWSVKVVLDLQVRLA